jgi:hypothetical protein
MGLNINNRGQIRCGPAAMTVITFLAKQGANQRAAMPHLVVLSVTKQHGARSGAALLF